MKPKTTEVLTGKSLPCVTDTKSGNKISIESHGEFQDRLRKTLYYGKYTDGTLPSPTVTDVAVKLINSKTSRRKSLDKYQAIKMTRRARISPCALMMGLLYTERLAQSNPSYLKKVSSSDLFMVSMLVASKYLYDDGEEEDVYNYDWSKAGNYHIGDLNRLEREFLVSIDWRIFVSYTEFYEFVNKIEARVALNVGSERGWFTYMDLGTLLENLIFQDLLKKCVKNTGKTILGCTLAYSVSVALLFSSSAIIATSLDQQNADNHNADHHPAMIPPVSFTGSLGHREHAITILQTIRKRHVNESHNRTLEITENNLGSILKKKENEESGNICGQCGSSWHSINGLKSKTPFARSVVKQSKRKCNFWDPCLTSDGFFNKTELDSWNSDAELMINKVLSLVVSPFNSSWVYQDQKFPIWENLYSGMLIGFSTSVMTTAAAA